MSTQSRLRGERLGLGLIVFPLLRGIALVVEAICIGLAVALFLTDLFAMVINWLHPWHYPFLTSFVLILVFLVLGGAARSVRDHFDRGNA